MSCRLRPVCGLLEDAPSIRTRIRTRAQKWHRGRLDGFPGEAKWVDDLFKALEARYTRVKAISWFEHNKDDGNYLLTDKRLDPGVE